VFPAHPGVVFAPRGWVAYEILFARLAEAAELLHVSVRHLRRLIAKGELESTRVGEAVRLSPEALASLVEKK